MTFYNDNAESYFKSTVNLPVGYFQKKMLKKLNSGDLLLDIGCGSGRDAAFFADNNLVVTAFDGGDRLVALANERFNLNAICSQYLSFESEFKYDAFWAMSSLVHLRIELFVKTLRHLSQFLKEGGVFYMSLKPESEHGVDPKKAIFFQGWSEKLFAEVLQNNLSDLFEADYEVELTDDVTGRDFKWLNIWLTKK